MRDDNNVASIDAAISNSVGFFRHLLARVIHSTFVSKDKYDESDERWITLQFTWSGKPFSLEVAESDRYVPGGFIRLNELNYHIPYRVFDLKAALQSLTDVPPERQKILGLVKGKLPPDQARM